MSFFKQFPKEQYSIEANGVSTSIVDIYRYVDVIEKASQNVMAYKTVDTFDGERPDNLSQRLYGTPDYYWTFFLTNDFLKDGIEAWPKGDSEVRRFIDDAHENLACIRFPYKLEETGDVLTLAGLPIMDENWSQYIRLYRIVDTSFIDGNFIRIYATAEIADYKSNLSQIWIDKSTITWDTDDMDILVSSLGGAEAFAAGGYAAEYQKRAESNMFFSGDTFNGYHVRFVNPYTPTAPEYALVQDLENKFISSVRETAVDLRPNQNFQNKSNDDIQKDYALTATQYWEFGKTAPAHYYNPVSINDEITEYASGPEAINYISREQDIMDENDGARSITYVSPEYIQSFAREYKKLINE